MLVVDFLMLLEGEAAQAACHLTITVVVLTPITILLALIKSMQEEAQH
jgi:hypothetical protein